MTHPYVMELLAQQRIDELRLDAARNGRVLAGRRSTVRGRIRAWWAAQLKRRPMGSRAGLVTPSAATCSR